jgi:hypothetical protein
MTVEYVLLLGIFAFFMLGTLIKGPFNAFENAGPKLGARVEKHLATGEAFGKGRADWRER